MLAHTRLLTAALASVVLLALSAGTATASRSFSVGGGGRAILAISLGSLTFEPSGGGTRVISRVTLHGSVHSLIAKSVGALAGVITSILTSECRTSVGLPCRTFGTAPPWHITLLAFTGTLPNITSILLNIRAQFLLEIGNRLETRCWYEGVIGAGGVVNRGRIERLEISPEKSFTTLIRAEGEEFFRRCNREGSLVGGFRLSPAIEIRLH